MTSSTNKAKVRVTEKELSAVISCCKAVALTYSTKLQCISVFGSRAKLNDRGGDIDLYVKLDPSTSCDLFFFNEIYELLF